MNNHFLQACVKDVTFLEYENVIVNVIGPKKYSTVKLLYSYVFILTNNANLTNKTE